MIVLPEITAYLDALNPGNEPQVEALRRDAIMRGVPIVKRETERFLKTMLTLLHPKEILEVGAAVGYSAILMADVCGKFSHITTIERVSHRAEEAKKNIKHFGMEKRITLFSGDADVLLPGFPDERYDFIFMDAAKGQYIRWLPHLIRCLTVGGLLLSDNVLQDGSVSKSRYAISRRDRTIHDRMRTYLNRLTHDETLETSVLPVGDGIAMTVKKGRE